MGLLRLVLVFLRRPGPLRAVNEVAGVCVWWCIIATAKSLFAQQGYLIKKGVKMKETLLATKLLVPRLPVQHVQRQRLTTHLERSKLFPFTLVSAPAGSGKTTFLVEWARQASMPVSWLSLERADGNLTRFLAYLLASLQNLGAHMELSIEEVLSSNPAYYQERILIPLINDLEASLTTDVALVFDDYHLIEHEAAHSIVLFLLEHLPQRLHLILGTRCDPPFPLVRWRARGFLNEIRSDVLRFTSAEIQAFLQGMQLELAPALLCHLEERTAGWATGIQLVALALRHHHDHDTFLRQLRGNSHFLLEYVREEILANLPSDVRTFLLQTSILERMTASLCDAVLQRTNSQGMLTYLRQANLFVSALDETGEWYCYHALLAEGFRYHLAQQEPELISALYQRASIWYEEQEMHFEACEYALQAKDLQRAIPLIEYHVRHLIGRLEFALLHRWLSQLPRESIIHRPLLGVASAWLFFVQGEKRQLEQSIIQPQQEHADPIDHTLWVEAQTDFQFFFVTRALLTNDSVQAAALAQRILEVLPENQEDLRHLGSLYLRLAECAQQLQARDFAAAERGLIEVNTHINAVDYPLLRVLAMTDLAELYEAQGALPKLVRLYQQLFQLFRSQKTTLPELIAWAYMKYAELLLEWNQVDASCKAIEPALAASQMSQTNTLLLSCRFVQFRICLVQGREETALTHLNELEKNDDSSLEPGRVKGFGMQARARWLLHQGKVDKAQSRLQISGVSYDDPWKELSDAPLFGHYMLLVRVLIAHGRASSQPLPIKQALTLLERSGPLYEQVGFVGRTIEIQILKSIALSAQGETQAALSSLSHALSLAEPNGFVRLFADEGEPMARLLVRLSARRSVNAPYIRTLLEAISFRNTSVHEKEQRQSIPLHLEKLSAREVEVLNLLVTGASNQEIAAQLVITSNTAKRHVKHILAKLGVTNRTQAIIRANELRLV